MGALAGKRVVNTRALHQAEEFDALLRANGAMPISFPCIEIQPVDDPALLDRSLAELCTGKFDWLAVTSANAVHVVAQRLSVLDLKFPEPPQFATAVVGPTTASATWQELGLCAETIPESFRAFELGAAMPIAEGQRVLVPQSEIASPDLANALTAKGAIVTTVTAYRTVVGSGGVDLPALLALHEVDAVVFASSSALNGCATRLGDDLRLLDGIPVVCIGPSTAQSALRRGINSLIVPAEHTLNGVMDALVQEFSALSKGIAQ